MPVFLLTEEAVFPAPHLADEDGIIAVGGDLSPERLIAAYQAGIFPWYSDNSPILWWSPDPRLVLLPEEIKVSRSLRRTLERRIYDTTFDLAFRDVMKHCAEAPRKDQEGTWITGEMIDAYCRLHDLGLAHSAESWYHGSLVGGLYGVAMGRIFFGESMFSLRRDASKAAFVTLVRGLSAAGYRLIDCQVRTDHLISLGAREVPRSQFLSLLTAYVKMPAPRGPWAD